MALDFQTAMNEAGKILADKQAKKRGPQTGMKRATVGFRREFCNYANKNSLTEALDKYPQVSRATGHAWLVALRAGHYDGVPDDYTQVRVEAVRKAQRFTKDVSHHNGPSYDELKGQVAALKKQNEDLLNTLTTLIARLR